MWAQATFVGLDSCIIDTQIFATVVKNLAIVSRSFFYWESLKEKVDSLRLPYGQWLRAKIKRA